MEAIDAQRLRELENVIESGLDTVLEVGNALAEIRDSKLYLAEFQTFEAYCRDRWKISRPRAYQLITAADVSTIVDVPSESHARELAPLKKHPALAAEAWEAAQDDAADEGVKPAARHLRKAVKRITDDQPKKKRQKKQDTTPPPTRAEPDATADSADDELNDFDPPDFHLAFHVWIEDIDGFWSLMEGDYLTDLADHHVKAIEADVDKLEKVLGNLKAALRRRNHGKQAD